MTGPRVDLVVRHLRRLTASPGAGDVPDGDLLRRYVARGDAAAFEELVRRHGPTVLQVGRRLLRHSHDVDDVFQATFLTLANRAGSVQKADAVGSWLHGVARCQALRIRTAAARRSARERGGERRPPADALAEITLREARVILDEELDDLSPALRAPLVLCYLEGLTQDEAAHQLGRSVSTLRRRLEKGRHLLRHRLARRGVTLSAVLWPAVVADGGAAVPAALIEATLRAATVPARAVLTLARWRIVAALVAAVGVCAAGAGLATRGGPAAAPPTERAAARTDYYGDARPPGVLARLGTVQLRHANAQVAFSADGRSLHSAGTDGAVRAWDVGTGRLVLRTPVAADGGTFAMLSPDGKHVATWGNQVVHLHDARTGKELHRLQVVPSSRESLGFSPDGKTLVTLNSLGGQSSICLWDVATGRERASVKKGYIEDVAISPDGKRVVLWAADNGGQLCLCDAATGAEVGAAKAASASLAIALDGKTFAAMDTRGTVTVWDAAALKSLATLKPARAVWQRGRLAYSPDGTLLAVTGEDNVVLWNLTTQKEQRHLPDRMTRHLTFSPDGKTLATAGAFEVRLWDVATGRRLHHRPGHDNNVRSVAVSPDGGTVASAAWGDPIARLWDAGTGKPLVACPRVANFVRSCEFTHDGKVLVADGGGVVRLVAPATGAELRRFTVEGRQEILVAHQSDDGKRLAAVSVENRSGERQLSVWDAGTGESVARRRFRGDLGSCFTPDGSGVTVKSGQLIIEEVTTGRERLTIPAKLGQPVNFSHDGHLIAAGIHETPKDDPPGSWRVLGVRVTEMATGKQVFQVEGAIDFTAFSPDGRRLATADPSGLALWDALTGEPLFRRAWPESLPRSFLRTPIGSLALLPGGRGAATGMGDGTVLVWDLAPETWPAGRKKGLDRAELDRLWADLAGDTGPAHWAIATLAAAPERAVPFLATQLPAAAVDAEQVRKLLGQLDSDEFRVRQAAARALAAFGEQIEPALREALRGKPSAELRSQATKLLEGMGGPPPAATLRGIRAVRVLEAIGSQPARRALEALAAGDSPARVTREAAKSLERMKRR